MASRFALKLHITYVAPRLGLRLSISCMAPMLSLRLNSLHGAWIIVKHGAFRLGLALSHVMVKLS